MSPSLYAMVVVLASGMVTALSTGLGALPFAFVASFSRRALAHASALAAGLMLGASFGLAAEGAVSGRWQTLVGVLLGLGFVLVAERVIERRQLTFGSVGGDDGRKMWLMVLVMFAHSIAEGVAVGAAFGAGGGLAFVVTFAIAIHNVPEGLAISAVLRPRGVSVARCAGWSVFSSLPQPLAALPAFLLVDAYVAALPFALGFASGAMILMVFMELLPDAYENAPASRIGLVGASAIVVMLYFQQAL